MLKFITIISFITNVILIITKMRLYSIHFYLLSLMALMQLFASSTQNRRPQWHQSHTPNYILANKIMNEDDECLNSNKCKNRPHSDEHQFVLNDNGLEFDGLDEMDVKRFVSKKFSTEEVMPSTSGSKIEEGRGIFFKSSRLPSCACDIRYELLDLHATGQKYYPRYVPSAVCTTEICWNSLFKCRPKYYKMYFLKHRDEPLDDINDSLHADQGPLVPESLKKDWTFVSIPVAVSCECLP